MTELRIQSCQTCGTNLFPARLGCPSCGRTTMRWIPAGPGRVEQETTLRRAPGTPRLGSVRLDAGPVLIARLANGVGPGTEVRLDLTPHGAIHARNPERSN